jgi:predicted phage-related endonuclease
MDTTRRIGGSDIAKLLGLSKYGGPFEVYQRIVEGIDEPGTPVMWRGSAMEPVLRAHGQRLLGWELEDMPDSDYLNSAEHEFARAQIDDLARWRGIPVVAEYKSQNRFARGWLHGADGDVVPESIAAQVAWQLMCTQRELAIVVVGFGQDTPEGSFELHNLATYEIQREPLFEAYCLQVAKEFWEKHVLRRVAPDSKPVKKRRAS